MTGLCEAGIVSDLQPYDVATRLAVLPDRAMREAVAYYTLASHYTRPRAGRILAMCGLSGAGESTVARALAK